MFIPIFLGTTETGEEIRITPSQVGLRRAEVLGQLRRVRAQPEFLRHYAEAYERLHPDAASLVAETFFPNTSTWIGIAAYAGRVTSAGEVGADDLRRVDAEVEALIDDAVTQAKAAPEPEPADLLTDVYVKY